jgi:ABC-2 type transport system ATP-binding protein
MYDNLSAAEYLELVACLHHIAPPAAASRIDELLELFGLAEVKNQRVTEYSKGMKQKVVLAAALIHRPEVLFLDEPLSGLDANAALIVKELLRRQGKTILFCSHILEVVERVCTRIVIINDGRKIIEGTAQEISRTTSTGTLEAAFSKLTGVRDATGVTAEFLAALERA